MRNRKLLLKWYLVAAAAIFILMNGFAIVHSYKFTHFDSNVPEKTKDPAKLTFFEKINTLLLGVNNLRPYNSVLPTQKFETIYIKSNKKIECWSIKTEKSKGTVILFHGFSSSKSSLIDNANIFINLGYNVFLVDFMGSGGSESNNTTMGFYEAEQVSSCYKYISGTGENNIILYGNSMGAAAILKSVHDEQINPQALILECPFSSMYQTVCSRFRIMSLPEFPMAGLLVFWGGIQNGFWAFNFNPAEYAKSVKCPVLLYYGEQDKKVSLKETREIFSNLNGKKILKTFPLAGHENYLLKYKEQWTNDVSTFLNSI